MKNITNFDLSKKIAEKYNVNGASEIYYYYKIRGEYRWDNFIPDLYKIEDTLYAFTVGDLIDLLPGNIVVDGNISNLIMNKTDNGYYVYYGYGSIQHTSPLYSVDLVDALGELLLYLIDKGYIKGKNEKTSG